VAVATIGYSVSILIAYIFEGQFLDDWRRRRMARDVRKLDNHVVICGAGKFGREVAAEFSRSGVPFVVVDRDPAHSELADTFAEGALYVEGDCEDDAALLEAGVDRARGVISALPEDDSNSFVVLTARQLNPNLVIVSQAADERSIKKLRLAGANHIVSPYRSAGRRMASLLLRPSVVSFLEEAMDVEQTSMQIDEVAVTAASGLVGRELRATGVGDATGAVILAIHGADGTRLNPTEAATLGSTVLSASDVLVAVGTDDQLQALRRFVARSA
jgi:voltage-gated potassium channel